MNDDVSVFINSKQVINHNLLNSVWDLKAMFISNFRESIWAPHMQPLGKLQLIQHSSPL